MQDLVTVIQFAKKFNVSRIAVYYWLNNGYLDNQYITIADKIFINKDAQPIKKYKTKTKNYGENSKDNGGNN